VIAGSAISGLLHGFR